MAYRLKGDASVQRDVRRVVGKQMKRTLEALESTDASQQIAASHDARRRIKKMRAALQLIQPTLDSRSQRTMKGLKKVSRLLAPMADTDAVLATLSRVAGKFRRAFSTETIDAMQRRFAEKHRRIMRKARLERAIPAARTALATEAKRVQHWRLSKRGFKAIARGLERTARDARRAMAVALAQPTTEHYHVWQRRAKSLWLQVRLLEGRCGGKLARVAQQLEALDSGLGDYHNAALLEQALIDEAPASRQETARALRLVRRYQAVLRRDAKRLGRAVHREKPTALVRRVRRYWRQARKDA